MNVPRKGVEACTGCDVCLLACPVWKATRDIRLTPHARAKALQRGARAAELAASIDTCTLCGSCEPACPENIALVELVLTQRTELAIEEPARAARVEWRRVSKEARKPYPAARVWLLSDALDREAIRAALGGGGAIADDDGADIALGAELGIPIPEARRSRFLDPLRNATELIVEDAFLAYKLSLWLPGKHIRVLSDVLIALPKVRAALRASDLYVLDTRAYHFGPEAGAGQRVKYYDELRKNTGCSMNLDLQRLAVATTQASAVQLVGGNRVDPREQAIWLLEGVKCDRIVVEDLRDAAAFEAVTDRPVVHLTRLIA